MTARPRRSVRVRACAKVNLSLRVLGIRPDGYHELRTTFQSLALHDTLTFEAVRGPFAITTTDPACPVDASNLVWRAAARLWEAGGRRGGVPGTRVRIRKRIPMEAGLAGGSSDAASTLRALRELWRLRLSDEDLASIGRSLGADVAFFLEGGTVLGVERGDLLFPLQDALRAWVVLVKPDFGVSTRDAYGWWDEAYRSGGAGKPYADRLAHNRLIRGTREAGNDLQPPVAARHPTISRLVRGLERSGALAAAMSGSGSVVFGLFDARATAERAARQLSSTNVTIWLTRTTNRSEHLRASAPLLI
jgi:4-diphosphocytidyl-2-C-methyl-D-erythritol kinase